MARAAGVEWKAVGASLDDLARTVRAVPAKAAGVFAYANSGVLQQAGVVALARYITPQNFAQSSGKAGRLIYTAPPGATHGKVKVTKLSARGETFGRDEHGRWHKLQENEVASQIVTEIKVFIKGKFVSRTGAMKAFAQELARTAPTDSVGSILAYGSSTRTGSGGDLEAGIDKSGSGYLTLSGGYRAAEAGSRGSASNGVKGWWRALRSVQGRWATLMRKRYPDLLKLSIR